MSTPWLISRKLILIPQDGSSWANTMVLNPAILHDPKNNRIHMLFRATGPYPEKKLPNKPLPFPIFLGYAFSNDEGTSWQADFSRPALAPALNYAYNDLWRHNGWGEPTLDYTNGCIEDPRLFWLDDQCFMTVASRIFPPGPYWEHDEPMQCAPNLSTEETKALGRAGRENVTHNVLYRVDLEALTSRDYASAFTYLCHLTSSEFGENRDVMPFPRKWQVDGKNQFVLLHRPSQPFVYPGMAGFEKPSIFISAAEDWRDFARPDHPQKILAKPEFGWEENRIGASAPPLAINDREWLLCYHGKQDAKIGYTQSFMILNQDDHGWPVITHRCSERLLVPEEPWEMPNRFETPCIFITGMIQLGQRLVVSYGAADERVGIAQIDLPKLLDHIRRFNPAGQWQGGR